MYINRSSKNDRKRTIVYNNANIDNKDIDRAKQKNLLDELVNNIAAKRKLLMEQENQDMESEENFEDLNLTTPGNEEDLKYDDNYEIPADNSESQNKVEESNLDEDDEEFFEEMQKDETINVSNKLQKPKEDPAPKKKFFEMYKSEYDPEKENQRITANFDSVYNTENLNINLKPSKNQFIRIYDDMMNDEEYNSPKKMKALRTKIFDFMRMNPISVDVGDMIIRLGMKHLNLDPIDNKGAIECFEVALKIYSQISDSIVNTLNAEKSGKMSLRKKTVDNDRSMMNVSAVMNQSNLINSSAGNINNHNPYKYKAVKIRQGETLRKITECYITEMDIFNAHKNIDIAMKHYVQLYGEKSKEVADCIFKKAYINQLESKWKDATELYNLCLSIYQNAFRYTNTHYTKISHIEIADCYFKLGLIKEKLKNFNLSMEYYKMALDVYKNHFKDDNNEECALTMFNIGLLNEIQDIKDKALKFYIQVKEIYSKIKQNSQDHIDILIKTSNLYIHFEQYEEASADLMEALTATIKKNKCESLGELLEMFLVEPGDDQVDVYAYNADLVEICFLLSKIYSIPEHKKYQEGFETLKIVMALMPPQREFLDETHAVLRKLLENLNDENYNIEWEDDIVDCITHFMAKMDIEVEGKKLSFEEEAYETNQSDNKSNIMEEQTANTAELKEAKESQQKEEEEKEIESDNESKISLTPKISHKNAFFVKQADMLQTLGKNCTRIKLYRSAVELYLKCVVYLENVEEDGPTKLKICDLMNQIALEYTSLTNFDAATKFF